MNPSFLRVNPVDGKFPWLSIYTDRKIDQIAVDNEVDTSSCLNREDKIRVLSCMPFLFLRGLSAPAPQPEPEPEDVDYRQLRHGENVLRYLDNFELKCREAGFDIKRWPGQLVPFISGSAARAWSLLSEDEKKCWSSVRQCILDACYRPPPNYRARHNSRSHSPTATRTPVSVIESEPSIVQNSFREVCHAPSQSQEDLDRVLVSQPCAHGEIETTRVSDASDPTPRIETCDNSASHSDSVGPVPPSDSDETSDQNSNDSCESAESQTLQVMSDWPSATIAHDEISQEISCSEDDFEEKMLCHHDDDSRDDDVNDVDTEKDFSLRSFAVARSDNSCEMRNELLSFLMNCLHYRYHTPIT